METDYEHIDAVLAGNKQAYAHLVKRYQNYVYAIAFRMLKNREEAEEAAQDVFVKAFRTLSTFNRTSKFSTWLYRITYNTSIDYTRKRKYNTSSIDETDTFLKIIDEKSVGQFEQLQSIQRHYYVKQLLKQLTETEAMIITLFYLKEQRVEEIGEMLGLTASNVKVKLHRIRHKLRAELEHLLNNEAKELL